MSKTLNFNLWTILHENMSRMNFAEKRFDKIPISSPGSFWLLASGMVVITSKVHHLPTVAHNCRGKRNNLAAKENNFCREVISLTYSFCREVLFFCRGSFSFAVRFFLLSESFSFCRDSCRGNRTYLLLGDHTAEKEPRRVGGGGWGGSNCAFCSVYTLHNYPRMSPLL